MRSTTHNPVRGFTLSLLGTVFLACNYVTAKYAMGQPGVSGFNPETLAVVWMWAATIYALIWAVGTRKVKELRLRGSPLRWMLALGVANAICQLTTWQGLQRLDPSFAAFLWRFAPMMAILMGAVLLKEKIRPWEWVAVALMIGGGAWSSAGTFTAEWVGIALSLVSSFFSAAQWPLAKGGGKGLPSVTMNFYRVGVAAAGVTIYALAVGKLDFSQAHVSHWWVTLLGSFLGPFLSYVLMFKSYEYWAMSRSAIVWTLQPLVVLPLAYGVFGTIPTSAKLWGGLVMVVAAVWLAALHRREEAVAVEE